MRTIYIYIYIYELLLYFFNKKYDLVTHIKGTQINIMIFKSYALWL